ncbi:hypothetical protein BGX38DRAFT_1227957 [Terfezia claveryi]|nr:hypothetical protein BGX38DRAFT_1227957 [Terfezia claveryi]
MVTGDCVEDVIEHLRFTFSFYYCNFFSISMHHIPFSFICALSASTFASLAYPPLLSYLCCWGLVSQW